MPQDSLHFRGVPPWGYLMAEHKVFSVLGVEVRTLDTGVEG